MAKSQKLYEDTSMVRESESKRVALKLDRISIAKKSHEQWAQDSGAKRFVKEYKGDYGIVFKTRKSSVKIPPVNEVFSYVQSDIATIYQRDPWIAVNAKAGTPKGAAFWEMIINYWWRELKVKDEMEYEIIDKDLVGFGWHKVGYSVESSGKNETLKIDNEKLYSNYLAWDDVLWNIGSKRPPVDCQWMAQRIVKPLSWIKKKYPQAKGLEGVMDPRVDSDDYKKSAYKDDIKVGVMWEIWDAEEKTICLIAEGLKDRYLEEKPWPEYLDEFPFLMYWDFVNPGSSRPMSAIAPWEPQILEGMVILGSAVNHVKRWNRQAFVKNGQIDDNALDKYEQGNDGAIINYNGENADIKLVDYGPLPPDFYLLMDRLDAIKRNINGQPEFAKGGVTKTNSRTMGELNLIQQGTKSRQDRKVDRFETHLENVARHMMAHLKANFDFESAVRITGEVPEEIIKELGNNFDSVTGTVKFSPDDIKGEYDIEIKSGSTLPLDKQTRNQILELVLNTVAQVAVQGSISPFINTLIQNILDGFEIKGLEEAYQQETMMAKQKAQAAQEEQSVEAQKTEAETAKRTAQAKEIEVKTQLDIHEAELGTAERIMELTHPKDEGQKVSESITYKDLPEEGRIQMAGQAGIHLSSAPLPKLPATNGTKP